MIDVEFPDGVRKWPSTTRTENRGGQTRIVKEPKRDLAWSFIATFEGGWRARAK